MSATISVAEPATRNRARQGPDSLWPLKVIVYGYPLWWLVGVASFVPLAMAVVMASQLARSRRVIMPPGMWAWVLFIGWVLLGLFTLMSDAPGAVPGADSSRLLVFGYRLGWYLACTVVVVWTLNLSRRSVAFIDIARVVAWLFPIAAIGGAIGLMVPDLEFNSLIEYVLPGGLRSNGLVSVLVHPELVDIQNVLGRPEARPKAPFPYANTWGSNIALSLPFLVVAWLRTPAVWVRIGAPIVMVIAAYPIVYSLNRGLWACLAVGGLFLVVLAAMRGRPGPLVGTVIAMGLAVFVVMATPLSDVVADRFANQHSNDRRGQLIEETVSSVLTGSPMIGFGSTRDVQGSFASIAGGGTADCPACRVPPLGTQGQLWLVIFSQGIVGAGLFCGFFAVALRHTARSRTDAEAVATCVLLFFGVQAFVYDTLEMPLLVTMVAIGAALREKTADPHRRHTMSPLTARSMRSKAAEAARPLAVCAVLGAIVVTASMWNTPPNYSASQSILLNPSPSHLMTEGNENSKTNTTTVDTEAALVVAESTMQRWQRAGDYGPDPRESITITATANTMVIHIQLSGSGHRTLAHDTQNLSRAYLETRQEYLAERRQTVTRQLNRRFNELVRLLRSEQISGAQRTELDRVQDAIWQSNLTTTEAGQVISTMPVEKVPPDVALRIGSGIAAGLGVGLMLMVVAPRRPRAALDNIGRNKG